MKGLIEIFYDPGKVFDYVRERRAWVAAFFACLILFGAVFAYTSDAIGAGNITRHSLENNKFAAQMTQEQKDQAIAQSEAPARRAITLVISIVVFAVISIIFALLFMAIAGVAGGRIKFTQALGAVSYASWPLSVIRSILSIIVISMAADKSDLDPQHLLAFNIGAFLDKATTSKPLYALASSFDVIIFAQIALAAYGLSRVAQISFTKALVGAMLIWAVFTAIGMGFSLVM